jgi:FkbM family methyltransferase
MAAEHDIDLLVRKVFFPNLRKGVLVEVGAARPDYLSIGASFRELGWKVIAIEPNPEFCAAHRALGFDVLEYAASDTEEDNADFFVFNQLKRPPYFGGTVSYESFSSLGMRDSHAASYESVKDDTEISIIPVKVRKLDTILATHQPKLRAIDILAVDVEGWELNVMRGLTIERYKPKVVILENNSDEPEYIAFMSSIGYERWRRLLPNDIYVKRGFRPGEKIKMFQWDRIIRNLFKFRYTRQPRRFV